MNIKDDAKPCPFGECPGTNLIIDLHRRWGHFVFCEDCRASGPYGQKPDEAIEAWNDRREPPPDEAKEQAHVETILKKEKEGKSGSDKTVSKNVRTRGGSKSKT